MPPVPAGLSEAAPSVILVLADDSRLVRVVVDVERDETTHFAIVLEETAVEAPLEDVSDVPPPSVDGLGDALLQRLDELREVVHAPAVPLLDGVDRAAIAGPPHRRPAPAQGFHATGITVETG